MRFINRREHNGVLYETEYLYHWLRRLIEFSYTRVYLVPPISSKHSPKRTFRLRLYKLSISLKVGEAPWEEL